MFLSGMLISTPIIMAYVTILKHMAAGVSAGEKAMAEAMVSGEAGDLQQHRQPQTDRFSHKAWAADIVLPVVVDLARVRDVDWLPEEADLLIQIKTEFAICMKHL